MTYPRRPSLQPVAAAEPMPQRPWTVTTANRPMQSRPPARRYEVMWLDQAGNIQEMTRIAPAIPAFEAAFACLARGTLVATPGGTCAIEDLLPGMPVMTRGGPRPLRWIGRILLPPANLRQDGGPDIYRITAEALGPNRPMPDLVLASAARIVHRSARLAGSTLGNEVLVPVGDFADGDSVMAISPMSAVQTFHLALDGHAIVEANGVAIETFHPSPQAIEELPAEYLRLYLSLFPQVVTVGDFGRQILPRMGMEAIAAISAA